MISGRSDLKVVLVAGPIDFRAGINKLVSLMANELTAIHIPTMSSCFGRSG